MMWFPVLYSLGLLAVVVSYHSVLAQRLKICEAGRWKCANSGCISRDLRCDGVNNCGDNSDEENCEQWTCPADYWKCRNLKCIKLSWHCNGRDNCGDNSDEDNCGRLRIDCPSYVMERSSVTCTCGVKMKQPHNVTWPGHSQSGSLSLTNVQRSDNGTQYTCLLTADGVREEAVYTLRVAYGPYKNQVSISPSNLVRNGTQPVTLTCNANNTYPPPYYEWEGVPCQKRTAENTCTFIIDPTNENVEATCRVESVTLSDGSQELHKNVLGTASVKQRATITFLPDCGEDFVANSSKQYFQSPGYPKPYAQSLYCAWHITAPKEQVLWLFFVNMRIGRRCREDYVTIYEGDEKTGRKFGDYCLGSWTRFQTTSGLLTVTFRSNDQFSDRSYNGFRAVFKTIPNCGGNIHVSGSIQTIQSPGYPVRYLDNMECVWTITASRGFYILFNFTDCELDTNRDYVQLVDGKQGTWLLLGTFTGSKEHRSKAKFKPLTSNSNKATIIFRTNHFLTLKGFNLEIQATSNTVIQWS
ncbi:uncharacterized protein [Littorina saxatilis]|uniref:uncharacterized protein isoform X2 n=1 Tax=Littorina saxatilis TaxID=31220 RepID=UPI0038B4BEFA